LERRFGLYILHPYSDFSAPLKKGQIMRQIAALLMMAGLFSGLLAQTNIGGNLGGMTLDSTGNPYVVDRDIIIPKGKYLTINSGCNLLFNPFTGITVQGNLKVMGTQQCPVLFTSINDSSLNPQATQSPDAFDWNGILVAKESGDVEVRFANLRYSVYGIKCQNPDILIMQSVFRQNGQFHFTINDKIQNVPENEPFSYNATNTKPNVTGGTGKPGSGLRSDGPSQKRMIVRYSSLGVGVVGVVSGVILAAMAQNFTVKRDHSRPEDGVFDGGTQWRSYESKRTTSWIFSGISFGLGGLGLAGFGLTFVF
jgi:hypothetical protein